MLERVFSSDSWDLSPSDCSVHPLPWQARKQSSFDNNVHITLMHVSSITVQTLLYRTHCFQVLIKWAFHMFKKVFDTVSVQKPHSQS